MLKTLKWVYDLGVRQERVRIASHLQIEAQRAKAHRETVRDIFTDSPKISKSRREKLQLAEAVDNRIQEIINNMFEDNSGHWVSGASLMFPDDKHKGEI